MDLFQAINNASYSVGLGDIKVRECIEVPDNEKINTIIEERKINISSDINIPSDIIISEDYHQKNTYSIPEKNTYRTPDTRTSTTEPQKSWQTSPQPTASTQWPYRQTTVVAPVKTVEQIVREEATARMDRIVKEAQDEINSLQPQFSSKKKEDEKSLFRLEVEHALLQVASGTVKNTVIEMITQSKINKGRK